MWLSEVTDRTYTVAWNAATDNVGVVRYIVDVDGDTHVVTGTQFSAPLPATGTTFFVQVRAEDAAGNVGRWSDPLIVELEASTPTPDVSPPAMSDSPNDRADQQPPN